MLFQMLMDTNLDTTQKGYAQPSQASGKALITLINEVLDQAKIESGRLELHTVPFIFALLLIAFYLSFVPKHRPKA